MKRKYELKRRAERLNETRDRIVQAAVDLHTTIGPAHTTISAIAERARVQRHTVYSHFPSETDLFAACSADWAARHPFPDATAWMAIEDPEQRLRAALAAVYEWYETVGDELDVFRRDARIHATTAELVAKREARLLGLRDALANGWPRRKAVRAALAHALELETWDSLVRRHGLTRQQAADAMLRFVASV
jgi:AcrR family transcriptional regulator